MPWLFIILGLALFISGLYGFVTALAARRVFALEAAELALLAVAWLMHHTTIAGWVALAAAVLVEAVRHVYSRSQTPSPAAAQPASPPPVPIMESPPGPPPMAIHPEISDFTPIATPPATPLPAPLPLTPLQPTKPTAPPLMSISLLRTPWQPAPEVFLASLRRGGERGAKLTPGSKDASIRLSVDGITLELECVARPLPRPQLEEAAAQSWDWPDAAKTVTAHVGQVLFTSHAGSDCRAASLRLHCRAQLALAEFAPVLAVLWPAAGRLIPIASLSQLASILCDFDLAKATCINFRTFPLEGAETGRFLCDTVGFSALGVADLEVECDGPPDAKVTAAIYQRAEQMFESESEINCDGATFECDGTSWRVDRGPSRFPPNREVARCVPSRT